MYSLKKRCKNHVDNMMQIFVNSMNESSETHRIITNNNQLEKGSHYLLANDNQPENVNENCEKLKEVNHSNNNSHESNNNNELNDNLNNEDEIIVDK